jgi:membrane protein
VRRNRWRWWASYATLRGERAAFDELERRERQRYLLVVQQQIETAKAADASWIRARIRRAASLAVVIGRRGALDDISTHAGALTYGAMLSIPPLLLFSASVTGFVLVGNAALQSTVLDAITQLLPSGLAREVRKALADQISTAIGGRLSLGLIGLAVLLWASSGFASRLRHALGTIFGTERTGVLTGRFVGMILGVLMIAAILGLTVLTWITALAAAIGPGGLLARIATAIGIAVGEFGFFLALYRLLTPGSGPGVRGHFAGALLFVIGWEALKGIGGFYFTYSVARSAAVYGAISGLFGIIAFLYATAWLLLCCAEYSAHRWQVRSMRAEIAGQTA